MESTTYDLFAVFRDIAALMLLLGNIPLLILTIAGREPSNKGILNAGFWLLVGFAGILTNARGTFQNRWPAVVMLVLTLCFWVLMRWVKRRAF